MSNIWITSDWHFCHDRDFIYEPRGFHSIWEMNKEIITRYNEVVDENDDVYVLGDLMLNNDQIGLNYIKDLKGNIHIIRGNHDTITRISLYSFCWNIIEICEGKYLNYKNYHFYLSHYPCLCGNYDIDKPLKTKTISLCGHTHTKDKFLDIDKGIIYHCEVDTNNCYPWLLDDIIENIKERTKICQKQI